MKKGKSLPIGENFAGPLVDWFEKRKRVFPWRKPGIAPYAVWISEVMLQQTRAEVVVPYFLRWMDRFPDVPSLARSTEDEVIKQWEGLGYYARARRLLLAAQYLMKRHGGELPSSPSLLAEIPGFGPYTVGAVASFAFRQKAAAVDGNVLRFLSRYLLIRKLISKAAVQEEFRQLTVELLPDNEPWVVMEAMIELGATVCKREPLCKECPLSSQCRAFAEGATAEVPLKSKPPTVTRLVRKAAILQWGDKILVRQVPAGQVMAGLFEFPYFEGENIDVKRELGKRCRALLLAAFDDIQYSFTRYQATLQGTLWEVDSEFHWEGYSWVPVAELNQHPFSSGHRRLCQKLLEHLQ